MSPKVALQYLLPHRLLSRLAYGVARSTNGRFKDWLIALVIRKFGVDMAEAADPEPRNYPHFNAFFTRELRPGARVADADPDTLLMPADGKVSQVGPHLPGQGPVLHRRRAAGRRGPGRALRRRLVRQRVPVAA